MDIQVTEAEINLYNKMALRPVNVPEEDLVLNAVNQVFPKYMVSQGPTIQRSTILQVYFHIFSQKICHGLS